jgi:hypothetical protein
MKYQPRTHPFLSTYSGSHRPRAAACVLVAASLAGALTGCDRNSDSTEFTTYPDKRRPPDEALDSRVELGALSDSLRSNSPRTVVRDFIAPADGQSTRNLMRMMSWGWRLKAKQCGVNSSFEPGENDRYDQALFPDFERIERDGIGLGEILESPPPQSNLSPDSPPTVNEQPVLSSEAAACLSRALPEFTSAQALQLEWIDSVVMVRLNSEEGQNRARETASCLRDRLDLSEEELPTLEAFFGVMDGLVTHLESVPEPQRGQRIAALDREATAAFTTCGPRFYTWLHQQLDTQRGEFIERHGKAVTVVSARLEASR